MVSSSTVERRGQPEVSLKTTGHEKVRISVCSYNEWMCNGIHEYTKGGNPKPPTRRKLVEWVLEACNSVFRHGITNITTFLFVNHDGRFSLANDSFGSNLFSNSNFLN